MSTNIILEAIADAENLKQATVESVKEELLEMVMPQVKKDLNKIVESKSILDKNIIKESDEEEEITDEMPEEEGKESEGDGEPMPEEPSAEGEPEVMKGDEGEIEQLDVDELTDLETEEEIEDSEDVDDASEAESDDEEEDAESMHSADEYTDEDFDEEFDDDIEVEDDLSDDMSDEESFEGEGEDDIDAEVESSDVEDDMEGEMEAEHEGEEDWFEDEEEDSIDEPIEETFEIVDEEEVPVVENKKPINKDARIKMLEEGIKKISEEMEQINLFQTKMRYVRKLVKEHFNGVSKPTLTKILDKFDTATTVKETQNVYNKLVKVAENKKKKVLEEAKKASPSKKNIQAVRQAKTVVSESLKSAMRDRQVLGDSPAVGRKVDLNEQQLNECYSEFARLAGTDKKVSVISDKKVSKKSK